ncbi:hypothetical protein D3C72_2071250 [compost metagenome]
MFAGVGQARGLVDGQGVHVGAQAEAARAVATHQPAHHAGAADVALDGVAPGFELFGHQRRGAVLVEAEFGVLVDVAADADEGVGAGVQVVQEGGGAHWGSRRMDLAMSR